MSDYIKREDAYEVLTNLYHHQTETQHKALREALDRVQTAAAVPVSEMLKVLTELHKTEKERDYWMDMAHSYETTILRLVEGITQKETNDAESVLHGKWIEYPTADGMNQCSVCGVLRFGDSNYCPNCGARMDEE